MCEICFSYFEYFGEVPPPFRDRMDVFTYEDGTMYDAENINEACILDMLIDDPDLCQGKLSDGSTYVIRINDYEDKVSSNITPIDFINNSLEILDYHIEPPKYILKKTIETLVNTCRPDCDENKRSIIIQKMLSNLSPYFKSSRANYFSDDILLENFAKYFFNPKNSRYKSKTSVLKDFLKEESEKYFPEKSWKNTITDNNINRILKKFDEKIIFYKFLCSTEEGKKFLERNESKQTNLVCGLSNDATHYFGEENDDFKSTPKEHSDDLSF